MDILDILKKYYVVTDNFTLDDIQYYPIFELKQCKVCKANILTFPINVQYHITQDHWGELEHINTISLSEIQKYIIDFFYPKDLEILISSFLKK